LATTQKILNATCISILALTGGGSHGHLGIIMMAQEYTKIFTTPLGSTVDSGPIAQFAICMDAVEAASMVCLHNDINHIHATHINCDVACKKIILASYANMVTETLMD
jgi:hypothetical protein